MPALLMRMSRRQKFPRTARKRASTECGLRRSQGWAKILIFAEASSLWTRDRADSSRAVRIRLQDSAAKAGARASPVPRGAPVMRATWPRRWGLEIGFEVRGVTGHPNRRDILSHE